MMLLLLHLRTSIKDDFWLLLLREPRITFTHASEEVALTELEKRAYEFYESRTEMPEKLLIRSKATTAGTTPRPRSIQSRKRRWRSSEPEIDNELTAALRMVASRELEMHTSDIADPTDYSGVTYGNIRKVRAALAAWSMAHEFLHLSPQYEILKASRILVSIQRGDRGGQCADCGYSGT